MSRTRTLGSGVHGAKFGMMMPGAPKAGQKFYQEQAPGVGMDRCEIVSVDEKIATPAGTFGNFLRRMLAWELGASRLRG